MLSPLDGLLGLLRSFPTLELLRKGLFQTSSLTRLHIKAMQLYILNDVLLLMMSSCRTLRLSVAEHSPRSRHHRRLP
jgi:hypothetical protein